MKSFRINSSAPLLALGLLALSHPSFQSPLAPLTDDISARDVPHAMGLGSCWNICAGRREETTSSITENWDSSVKRDDEEGAVGTRGWDSSAAKKRSGGDVERDMLAGWKGEAMTARKRSPGHHEGDAYQQAEKRGVEVEAAAGSSWQGEAAKKKRSGGDVEKRVLAGWEGEAYEKRGPGYQQTDKRRGHSFERSEQDEWQGAPSKRRANANRWRRWEDSEGAWEGSAAKRESGGDVERRDAETVSASWKGNRSGGDIEKRIEFGGAGMVNRAPGNDWKRSRDLLNRALCPPGQDLVKVSECQYCCR